MVAIGGRGSSGHSGGGGTTFSTHNGLTYVSQDFGDGYGRVGVLKTGGGEIGAISWMPGPGGKGRVVGDIRVSDGYRYSDGYRRDDIAGRLWQLAQKATGGTVAHHPNRTGAGEKFARRVGGNTPPRSDWRG